MSWISILLNNCTISILDPFDKKPPWPMFLLDISHSFTACGMFSPHFRFLLERFACCMVLGKLE